MRDAMILRAIFWIAVVAVLMPREPNLGLGQPGLSSAGSLLSKLSSEVSAPGQACQGRKMACAAASGAIGQFHNIALQSLGQVKAEIEAQKHQRLAAGARF
jgi:hypothetical protein